MNPTPKLATTTFQRFGVRPVINACGIYTDLGGTVFSPRVWQAMQEINTHFVRMVDLLDRSGEILAKLVGAQAARVVPGASAAITLGTAACIAGKDGHAWEQLPDTTGLKNEVLIQKAHRYKYDRMVRIAGGRLIEVGTTLSTTAADLEKACTPRTAMIMFPAHLDGRTGTLPLVEVSHRPPACYPPARRRLRLPHHHLHGCPSRCRLCFGAKYFWDRPPAVSRTPRFIEAGRHRFHSLRIRASPSDALQTPIAIPSSNRHLSKNGSPWITMRWSSYAAKVASMRDQLADLKHIKTAAISPWTAARRRTRRL
jgi:hypothetical protein